MNALLRRQPELWILPALTLLIHLLTWRGYGWFRDEFYYVACARHLAWGYVDQPPLSIAILRLVTAVFGESLHVIRAVPALAGAVTVLLAGLIARELGGRRLAQGFGMAAAAAAPEAMSLTFYYSMNAFDLVLWPAIALALLVALRTQRTRSWAWLGVLIGLGLLNKVSVLWIGGGIAAGLLFTRYRTELGRRGVWLAAAIAAALFIPHIVWQFQHGWPTLEFMRNAGDSKMAHRSALAFAGAVINDEGIVVALIGLVGIATAFAAWVDRRARILAWIWLSVFVLLAANGTSRSGYLAPAWTLSFALGGLALERALARRGAVWNAALFGLIAAFGLVALPIALPVLPTDRYVKYAAALGHAPSSEEKKDVARLSNFFADMNGWESIVGSLDAARLKLPADELGRAMFFGTNYGEAGAIDVLGRARGLPPAIATHNNYFFWGPPSEEVDAIVVMSQNPARWAAAFEHVELAGETACGDCMPYENHRKIYIAWGRRMPWAAVWPGLKHFD